VQLRAAALIATFVSFVVKGFSYPTLVILSVANDPMHFTLQSHPRGQSLVVYSVILRGLCG